MSYTNEDIEIQLNVVVQENNIRISGNEFKAKRVFRSFRARKIDHSDEWIQENKLLNV